MREILFRGKRIDRGGWVSGDLVAVNGYSFIVIGCTLNYISPERRDFNPIYYQVIPETVGQYTGLTDRNGVKGFEGDIVNCFMLGHIMERMYLNGLVEFTDGCFNVEFKTPFHDKRLACNRYRDYVKCFVINGALEIIGNIHDNPELLEGKE